MALAACINGGARSASGGVADGQKKQSKGLRDKADE
jgi:hypothetical protein